MERACLLSTDTIDAAHLLLTPGAPLLPIASALPALSATPSIAPRSGPITTGRLRDAERQHIMQALRSEEHTSELQSLMRISYAVFCLKKKHNYNRQYLTTPLTNLYNTHQHVENSNS